MSSLEGLGPNSGINYSSADAAADALAFVEMQYDPTSVTLCGYELGAGDLLLRSAHGRRLHEETQRLGELARMLRYCQQASGASELREKFEIEGGSSDSGSSISDMNKNISNPSTFFVRPTSLPLQLVISPASATDAAHIYQLIYSKEESSSSTNSIIPEHANIARKNKRLKQLEKDFGRDSVLVNGKLFQGTNYNDAFASILCHLESKCFELRREVNYVSEDGVASSFKLFATYCLLLASTSEIGEQILLKCLESQLQPSTKRMVPDLCKPTKLRVSAEYEAVEEETKEGAGGITRWPRCKICCDMEASMTFEIRLTGDTSADSDLDLQDSVGHGARSDDVLVLHCLLQQRAAVYLDSMDKFYSESKVILTA